MSDSQTETLADTENVDSQSARPEILIVDDSRVIRRAAVKMLGKDYTVHEATDGEEGWAEIQRNTALSVVFTDMQMPNMNGLELLDRIRQCEDERIRNLAVIILTGQEDTEEARQEVFDHGATDFISKPFDSLNLISRARSYARLVNQVAELEKQSGLDRLTGLLDTEAYTVQGEKALSFARRHQLAVTTVHFEIDAFRDLYLKHGKRVVQQIVFAIGKKLQQNLREEDVAARIGVAKYAMLLPATGLDTASAAAERILRMTEKLVFDTGSEKIRVALAAGISSPDVGSQIRFEEVIEQADAALEQAGKTDSRIASFQTPASAVATDISEQAMREALNHILLGEYQRIPDEHLPHVMRRLQPFLDFAGTHLKAD